MNLRSKYGLEKICTLFPKSHMALSNGLNITVARRCHTDPKKSEITKSRDLRLQGPLISDPLVARVKK